jgi:hypothetical protein
MNFLLIILGVVIVILGYVLYMSYQSTPSVKLMDLGKPSNTPIPTSTYPTVGTSTRYAYGVWIYMNQLGQNSGQIYPIFFTRKGGVGPATGPPKFDTGNSASTDTAKQTQNYTFIVYLDANMPKLHFGIWTQGTTASPEISTPETGNPDGKDCFHAMITDNFTLQRWVYLVISVDNQFVDLYLDGKLVKSVKMANLPYQDSTNVVNTNITAAMAKSLNAVNFGVLPGTYIANFQRWETPLDPQSVWNYYMQGNGQSSKLLNYNVNLDFVKDDKLTSQWKLL